MLNDTKIKKEASVKANCQFTCSRNDVTHLRIQAFGKFCNCVLHIPYVDSINFEPFFICFDFFILCFRDLLVHKIMNLQCKRANVINNFEICFRYLN